MALTDEEKSQLEALQAKANAPDDSDDFEVEIWDENGKGARVPYKKGRSWLQSTFGIDLDPPPSAEGDPPQGDGKPDGTPAQRYFGGSRGKKTA